MLKSLLMTFQLQKNILIKKYKPMLYYLFEFLQQKYQFPGAGLYQFLSFRAAVAMIISLGFSLVFGRKIINYLITNQIGESVRKLGLKGEKEKKGTPTMGGLIIIFSTIVPVILLAKLENIYILLLLFTAIWMGTIGGIDDCNWFFCCS